MTSSEIIARVRRDIREPSPRKVTDAWISDSITDAINLLALLLTAACPEYFQKRVTLTSNTNVFALPSDNSSLERVWDLDTNAGDITGAADNGSGLIQITQSSHGKATGDIVTIHDVVGTTEANDTWKITKIDADTYDLAGSTFTNAYTSGGKAFTEQPEFLVIDRFPAKDETIDDETGYHQRGSNIIVDDPDFTNDLLILYRYLPTALTEIPSRFHYGIAAYSVIDQIRIMNTSDLSKSLSKNESLWGLAQKQASEFKPISETRGIKRARAKKQWI